MVPAHTMDALQERNPNLGSHIMWLLVTWSYFSLENDFCSGMYTNLLWGGEGKVFYYSEIPSEGEVSKLYYPRMSPHINILKLVEVPMPKGPRQCRNRRHSWRILSQHGTG